MPSNGVSKTSGSKPDSIDKLRKVAGNTSLSSPKLESARRQAIMSDANPSMSTKSYSDESNSDQTQQNVTVDDNSTPHPDKPIRSIEGDEGNEIEMTNFGANRNVDDQREPTQNGSLDVQNDPNHSDVRSSREQSVGSLAGGLRRLAILDPPMKKNKGRITQSPSPDPNEVVDGWGTLSNSNFVIVQEGPTAYAKFTFKWRHGYTNGITANISDSHFRVTDIADYVNGKWKKRYGRENVVCFSGAAIQDNVAQDSTRSPCSWLRVEWRGLSDDDLDLCNITKVNEDSQGHSWIPKGSAARLCYGPGGGNEKVKEVWDAQERDYVAWAQKQPQGENCSRSTTPCPLNDSVMRLRQRRATPRRATSRWETPEIRVSSPADDGHSARPSSRQNDVVGTRSNLVSLVEDTESVDPAASSELPYTTTSNGSSNRDTPGHESQPPILEISWAEFIKEQGSEKWVNMDPSERQIQEVKALALYKIYKATMLQNTEIVVKDLDKPDSTED
ncbi:hypothetical protein N7466_001606 [Penicillium verhagenii]|uniref:uncharacterized protein n=1 Tax=Penicillium verhagenii TaxID=1562060 RepID=UPI0025451136|nr:uncharacterized protein N7466_001606 [Penicillium verhagenii]KAJ5938472.1 hypothetical protein N7466_001606 [Penicillium verhagenii]